MGNNDMTIDFVHKRNLNLEFTTIDKVACIWIKWVIDQMRYFNNVTYSIVAEISKFIIVLTVIKRKQIFNTWRTQPVLQVVKHVFNFYRKQWDTFHMVNFFATMTDNFICMIGDRLTTNGTVRHDTNSLGWKAWQEQKHLNDNLIFRIAELHETIKEIQWEQLNWVNLWIVFINLVKSAR